MFTKLKIFLFGYSENIKNPFFLSQPLLRAENQKNNLLQNNLFNSLFTNNSSFNSLFNNLLHIITVKNIFSTLFLYKYPRTPFFLPISLGDHFHQKDLHGKVKEINFQFVVVERNGRLAYVPVKKVWNEGFEIGA